MIPGHSADVQICLILRLLQPFFCPPPLAFCHWATPLRITYITNVVICVQSYLDHTLNFYTPVFRRDVLSYGDVRPSVRLSGSPSVRHSFPHFSPTCSEILSWNFVYYFILMHVRSSSNAITFRQFLLELCPFWTSHSYKYAVFRIFILHALTYWAEILHMTLFYSTSDQVRVSSICVNFCWSYASFGIRLLEIHSFPYFSLTSFDILSWYYAYDFLLLYFRLSLSVVNLHKLFWELCPFWNLEYWKYTVFRTFILHALIYWAEILHMTFLMYYRSSSSVVNFCRSYIPFGTYNTGNTQFSALFSYILWHIDLKFYIWLRFSSSVINLHQFL